MKFNEKYDYPTSFDRVWQMYQDPQFTIDRLEEGNLQDITVDVDSAGDRLTVTASGGVDRSILPAAASRFISGNLSMQVTEQWVRSGDTAQGRTTIRISGAPVAINAESKLSSAGPNETERQMTGDLKVSVPLLGRKLESEAMRFVPQLIKGELAAASTWLAAH